VITLSQACDIALNYYKTVLHINSLAGVSETERYYIFNGGKPNMVTIGGVIITIDKDNAQIAILHFPSKESTDIIRAARRIELPKAFL